MVLRRKTGDPLKGQFALWVGTLLIYGGYTGRYHMTATIDELCSASHHLFTGVWVYYQVKSPPVEQVTV